VTSTAGASLASEAIRVYRRYAVELVEALTFCPYAKGARVAGQTREIVLEGDGPSDAEVLAAVEAIGADEAIEIGLLLLPRVYIERQELGRWVEVLRKAHAAAHGGKPILAIEGFHPDAAPDLGDAERLTPFVRRTPDPTLQLSRLSTLVSVRRGTPAGTGFIDPTTMDLEALLEARTQAPLHERIADANLLTVWRLGPEDVERVMLDILRDRDRSYARIDPTIPPRAPG